MVSSAPPLGIEALSEIGLFRNPSKISSHGSSAWARSYRIDTTNEQGQEESYFMKVSVGEHGRAALKGEFEATSSIHLIAPDFTPRPITYGSFKSIADSHYYICKFYELAEELPEASDFCSKLAGLHSQSKSPNGKFGFHVVTYNGDLPQENGYADTWEEFFINGFKHMLNLNIERGGPWKEMEELKSDMISKVITRLLRPLETGGRSIKPSLVHGDLWCGNAAVDTQTDRPLIYDPASFYAHNEYEMGNWRPERNKFSRSYFNAYHSHIPKSFPEEDYDDRNALYAMRFNLQAAALFPEVASFRESVVSEMKRLIKKHPVGFGTFQNDGNNDRVKDLVLNALRCGYRHIDTAAAYGNERQVGEAIKESGIPREDLFITTKLAQTWHDPQDVEAALDQSLRELGLEFVPHAYAAGPNHTTLRHPNNKPVINKELSRDYPLTWRAMEKLVDSGKTRLIGVSNFNILKLRRVLEAARIPPAVNQVELHPYLPQIGLLRFCAEHSIHVTGHQPLGGNPVAAVNPNADRPGPLRDPEIQEISKTANLSPAQVLLAWALHRQTSAIPKTVQTSRMAENIALSPLSEADRARIDRIAEDGRTIRFLDPSEHIRFDIFDEEADQPV
ncbi:NADP-dependent oxidoreductase domain-containing protein [Bisporella sp. PMI_857]|nr:NADP-dependent oxidoreductase domain-containing protein [Bisporella sp. PMI_857]